MRKILMLLLVLAITVCGAVGIAACGKDPDPEQNQGQVEQEKEKEKEEEKTPEQDKGDDGEEGKGDEGGKEEQTPQKPADGKDPETPEEQKPNPENPKDEEQKEEDKQEEEDKKDDGKEEEPPQGDEPGTDESGTEPDDEPGKPEEKPETKPQTQPEEDKKPETKPETKPQPQPQPQPQPEPQPEPEEPPKEEPEEKERDPKPECNHQWTYTFHEMDFSSRHTKVCSLCGETKSELCTFDREGGVLVEATCTENGYTKYTCSVCHNFFKAYGYNPLKGYKYPATGHQYAESEKWTHKDGDGEFHSRTCTVCGAVDKQACTFTITPATCTTAATQKCDVCGFTENVSNSQALDHQWKYDRIDDNTHRKSCTRPGCSYVATDEQCHTITEHKDATCTMDGYDIIKCQFCQNSKTVTIPKTGHHVSESYESDANGHYGKCTVCGVEQGRAKHDFTKSNLCSVCNYDGLIYSSARRSPIDDYTIVLCVERNEVSQSAPKIILPKTFREMIVGIIKSNAFAGNTKLTEIFIPTPQGVALTIEDEAFKGCTSLTTIKFQGSEEQWKKTKYGNKFLSETKIDNIEVKCNSELPEELQEKEAKPVALPAADTKRLYA